MARPKSAAGAAVASKYSISISEWDASGGRFEERRIEPISRVVFKMATGNEVELKFTNDGAALDIRTQGTIRISPVAANMVLIEGTK